MHGPLCEMREISGDCGLGEFAAKDRKKITPPGNDADIGRVALVAAASEGQCDQRYLPCWPRKKILLLAPLARTRPYALPRAQTGDGFLDPIDLDPFRYMLAINYDSDMLQDRPCLRPAAREARDSLRHRSRRRQKLPRKNIQRGPLGMTCSYFQHHFARVSRMGIGAIKRLGANHFDQRLRIILESRFAHERARSYKDRLAGALRLFRRVAACDGQFSGYAEAVRYDGADLVKTGRRRALRAGHADVIGSDLLNTDLSPVANHVRQRVGGRISHLIDELFRSACPVYTAAGAGGFREHE